MDRSYVVYEHWRTDMNAPFYVGKGKAGRERRLSQRGAWHKRVVAKLDREGHRVEIKVVEKDLLPESAACFEKMRIAYWRALKAPLVNTTDGGDGTPGYRFTDEQKAKISTTRTGQKLSEEHKAKVSAAMKGRFVSDETRTKMSKNNPMKRPEVAAKIGNARRGEAHPMFGTTVPQEQKAALSEKMSGEGNPYFGRKHSDAVRAKMRAAWAQKRADKLSAAACNGTTN